MPDNLKGHWSKAAIGGLVLVNAVLMAMLAIDERSRALAVQPALAGPPTATSPSATRSTLPAATPTPKSTLPERTIPGSPTASPSAEKSSSPSSTKSPGTGLTRARRILAVNSATLGWRALVGRCPTDPQVEVTRDGGRTWRSTDAGLRSVSRMRSYSESSVFAVGGNEDCESRYVATGGPGESWSANPRLLGQTWYRVPSEDNRVHAPDGRLSTPCGDELSDFAGVGIGGAAAICSDGTVRLTQDGGREWRNLDGATTGRSVGADEEVYVLALRSAECTGTGVVLLTPGVREIDDNAVRCAPVGSGPDAELAVAVRGQVLWLWAGEEVAVSTDRGRNWDRT